MKRPPGIWLPLLSAGILWMNLHHTTGLRATSLVFGKSTTTTTTTATPPIAEDGESPTEVSAEPEPRANFTGIPQIDYRWDPNLPRELNGFNLSDYPFYDRVPPEDEIEFKCDDDLHDGFYADIAHKCQVYHHCISGIRYDFLCANYTAFDQKTFICQFVSVVDCKNSAKFWHRNDALYVATTTSTAKPTTTVPTTTTAAPSTRRPGGRRRRPSYRRRRPQYDVYDDDYYDTRRDYYDDERYDDAPRSQGRRRTRPRPRPVYEEDYDEYEEPLDRRTSGRRNNERKPNTRRGQEEKRNKDRDRVYQDDVEADEDPRFERPKENERRRQPADDEVSDERRYNKRRPLEDDERPLKKNQRPDDEQPVENTQQSSKSGNTPLIKPSSGSSVYDRPRAPPKIRRPVPINEQSKFAYKPIAKTTTQPPISDEEYYDEYEDEPPQRPPKRNREQRPKISDSIPEDIPARETKPRGRPIPQDDFLDEEPIARPNKRPKPEDIPERDTKYRGRPKPQDDFLDEEPVTRPNKPRPRDRDNRFGSGSQKHSIIEDDYEEKSPPPRNRKPQIDEEDDKPLRPESVVRVVKRPFLPSRGGNPYMTRGLQPIGSKANRKEITEEVQKPVTNKNVQTEVENTGPHEEESLNDDRKSSIKSPESDTREVKPIFKPSPEEKYKMQRPTSTFRPSLKQYKEPTSTTRSRLIEKNPLDIAENEYDVTLNDALNPTLPNLPVRGFPTGFSSDYTYTNFPRARYVTDPILNQASSVNTYAIKPPSQQGISSPSYNNQFSSSDYNPRYTTASGRIFQEIRQSGYPQARPQYSY